jgi:hypothetical protein
LKLINRRIRIGESGAVFKRYWFKRKETELCFIRSLSNHLESPADPRYSGEIGTGNYRSETGLTHQLPTRFRLVVTMFHEQGGPGYQVRRRGLNDRSQAIHAVATVGKRYEWLKPQVALSQVGIRTRHIWRIRND